MIVGAGRITKKHESIDKFAKECMKNAQFDPELYKKYEVKRGLRDVNGKGVLTGLTEISEITSYTIVDSDMIPCEGRLYYRGIEVKSLVDGFINEGRFGFEEIVYLLVFGELPTKEQLDEFKDL